MLRIYLKTNERNLIIFVWYVDNIFLTNSCIKIFFWYKGHLLRFKFLHPNFVRSHVTSIFLLRLFYFFLKKNYVRQRWNRRPIFQLSEKWIKLDQFSSWSTHSKLTHGKASSSKPITYQVLSLNLGNESSHLTSLT